MRLDGLPPVEDAGEARGGEDEQQQQSLQSPGPSLPDAIDEGEERGCSLGFVTRT
jgi:hypothetical protein